MSDQANLCHSSSDRPAGVRILATALLTGWTVFAQNSSAEINTCASPPWRAYSRQTGPLSGHYM